MEQMLPLPRIILLNCEWAIVSCSRIQSGRFSLGENLLRIQSPSVYVKQGYFPSEAKMGWSAFQVSDIERQRSWLQILILISHFLPVNPISLFLKFSWQICSSSWVLTCSPNLGTYLSFSEGLCIFPVLFFKQTKEVCFLPFKCNHINCSSPNC